MDYKLVGSPCGEHGPYVFYKALKYTKNGLSNILALSEFFFVRLWTDSDLISIGELQLLWEDKNNDQTLASLRLYILPENTPDGRTDSHGEDEVLAITEKVVIRVEDLLTWITQSSDWTWGRGAIWERDCPQAESAPYNPIALDMEDINKEKLLLGEKHWETMTGVVVLSYPRYCRFRGILKRLEGVEDKWMKAALTVALGGFTTPWKDTRILFCKDTFDYPELEGHELLCNHLAPKLKGRPRKRKKASVSPGESESESESSQSTSSSTSKAKVAPPKVGLVKPRLRCTLEVRKPSRGPSLEERNFMTSLHLFMKERKTPINKIPIVGFKEVNLFQLYKKVKELGGYDAVSSGKLWKFVYEVMGGDMSSTSAATLSRRHYEKLLLPFERHMNGNNRSNQNVKLKSLPPVPIPQLEIKSVTSMPRALSPLIKKQKLEILKEGGLEVTPVGSRASVIKQATPQSSPPPTTSFQPLSPPGNKISITVTPDMSHLLCPPGPSKRTIYDNPRDFYTGASKDVFHPPPKRFSLPEVLDLRTKPKINIGSNLEITLVPPKNAKPQLPKKKVSLGSPKTPHVYHPYPGNYKPYKQSSFVDFSALYNPVIHPTSFQSQPPRPDHLHLYKEFLRRQAVFPSLIKDGSTSITLVGQTPTSK
ncbi:AT-rich interactive domain-containing protein 5B-like isoform X2 [Cimex lectularius]|uniref:ARID domain-containing protein n=1 Tax=Cimex lectularius TaxID=79782 RepID=A0A8I6TKU0_CIMLE|nr:AT-rich interactive domain-containing protein 5B-like isoform X2 [Cimex lectularius]